MTENPFQYQEPLLSDASQTVRVTHPQRLRQSLSLLQRGCFLIVTAPPRSGVTSFLYELRANLPKTALLDLANFAFADNSVAAAAASLAFELQHLSPTFVFEHAANLTDVLNAYCSHAQREQDTERTVVIVDGFDALDDETARRIALALRAGYTEARMRGAQRSAPLSIVTGSAVDLRDLTASGRTSPLNIAQTIFLNDFNEEEVSALLRQGFGTAIPSAALEDWIHNIYHWMAGHPALTQMMGHLLFESQNDGRTAEEAWNLALEQGREAATEFIGAGLGVLNDRPDLRQTASEIYSGYLLPFDRVHRPIRDLYHLGLICPDLRGFCKPRNALYEQVLASALNLGAPNPSIALWKSSEKKSLESQRFSTELTIREQSEESDNVRKEKVDFVSGPLSSHTSVYGESLQSTQERNSTEPPVLKKGAIIGGCRIERQIGRGAMAEVYLARHLALDTDVAIKLLKHPQHEDRRIAQRFLREARAAAQLSHENIVQIRNVGREGPYRYIEMEYLAGGNLAQFLEGKPFRELRRAMHMLRDTVQGVQAAHNKRIIHRDIKPDNLMLTENGRVKVVDFGLAAITFGMGSRLTQEGTIIGTPHYMAPEQWEGVQVDEASDIYSIGATFYHLLAGRPPFEGRTALELLANYSHDKLKDLREYNPELPEHISRSILGLLAKVPEERYRPLEILLNYEL